MSHEFVSITDNIGDTYTNTCDMYTARQRQIHDPVISSQYEIIRGTYFHLHFCNLCCDYFFLDL
jgi:hypothetical protein